MTVLTPPAWFTDALATAPRIDTVDVAGVTISYRSWGSSRPGTPDLLLVHGGAAHARWWDHLAPALALDRRVVAMDMSGHGDSGHRTGYSLDRWADELAAVIDVAGLARPTSPPNASTSHDSTPPGPATPLVVAGHSLGGMVTAVLARRGTPALSGAIVIDSPIEPSGPPPRAEGDPVAFSHARVYATEDEAVARFRPVPAQPTIDYIAEHIARASVREVDGGWGWKFDRALFVGLQGAMPRTLDGLPCPVAMIMGEHGLLSEDARAALRASAEVQVIEVPDAGHAIMLDQPLLLLQGIRSLLAAWQ